MLNLSPGFMSFIGDGWTLRDSASPSAVASIDFTDLGAFEDLLLILDGVTRSVSLTIQYRVSSDNGSSFYSGATDYYSSHVTAAAQGFLQAASTSTAFAVYYFPGFSKPLPLKGANINLNTTNPSDTTINRTEKLNAIQVRASTGTLSGGPIEVWGRMQPKRPQWTLRDTATMSGNASVDFTDLGVLQDLMVIGVGYTRSASQITNMRVSSDNGSSFYTTSGDYYSHGITAGTAAVLAPAATSAGDAIWEIRGFSLPMQLKGIMGSGTTHGILNSINRPERLNAVRLFPTSGNFAAGVFEVWGR